MKCNTQHSARSRALHHHVIYCRGSARAKNIIFRRKINVDIHTCSSGHCLIAATYTVGKVSRTSEALLLGCHVCGGLERALSYYGSRGRYCRCYGNVIIRVCWLYHANTIQRGDSTMHLRPLRGRKPYFRSLRVSCCALERAVGHYLISWRGHTILRSA